MDSLLTNGELPKLPIIQPQTNSNYQQDTDGLELIDKFHSDQLRGGLDNLKPYHIDDGNIGLIKSIFPINNKESINKNHNEVTKRDSHVMKNKFKWFEYSDVSVDMQPSEGNINNYSGVNNADDNSTGIENNMDNISNLVFSDFDDTSINSGGEHYGDGGDSKNIVGHSTDKKSKNRNTNEINGHLINNKQYNKYIPIKMN